MSRKEPALLPHAIVNVTSLGNGKFSQKDEGFAKPFAPPRPKAASGQSKISLAQPVRKRKSRFSDAPPSSKAPPLKVLQTMPNLPQKTEDVQGALLQESDNKAALVSAAAAAAARINASLLAQGKIKSLPPSANPQLTSPSTASTLNDRLNPAISAEIKRVDDMYVTEVEINDIPVGCRNYLTRLSSQESINKSCFAYVSTRGKYMTSEEKAQNLLVPGSEKPLYLFVQGQSELNVKKALDRIKQIINNHFEKKSKYQSEALAQIASLSQRVASSTSSAVPNTVLQAFTPGYPLIPTTTALQLPHIQPALPCGNFIQEKVFIGMDSVPEHFDLKNKLLGQNYRNFNFISNQTGAKVILRGKGSGFMEPTSGREAFESMYAFISHPNQAGVDASKKLVLNLVETVKKELPPLRQSTHNTMPQGYSTTTSMGSVNYHMVPPPPPPMPVPLPSTQTTTPTTYPFQKVNIAPLPVPSPSDHNQPYRDEDNNVLGYQHNFAGTDYSSRSGSSSKRKTKERPKKKFTEESLMLPPPPPPPDTYEENRQDSDKSMKGGTKPNSLPFWMTN